MSKRILLVLALGSVSIMAGAQGVEHMQAGKPGMYPQQLEFKAADRPAFVKGEVVLPTSTGLKRSSEVVLKHSETDMLGQEHFRYQQTIQGIPVEGATYVVHVANGRINSENGIFIAEPPAGLGATPSITESSALQAAMQAFGAKVYKWLLPDEEAFIKKESGDPAATFLPKAALVYYSGEESVDASALRLAYKLDIYAQEPLARRIYFIDAENGKVLGQREVLHSLDATGTAQTAYSGSQPITTDSYNGSYRLREAARGLGIQTFNLNKGTTYSSATDFTDADNAWNNVNANLDQYAADAHWGAEMTYDYYKNTFNRNSINNAGFAIKSYVHYSTNYFNAFWDGSRMTYGDGNSSDNYKPLTALDVCGHEITHGLTSYTANLNYSGESGALNEGFSDVFGTTIEFYAKPTSGNWLIGEAFSTIRSMSNPNAYGQPDTYHGVNWATGTADYGGVHTNSGVLNYWYYLLTQGGSGTNDNGYTYTVSGIGLTKAAAIAYRTLTVYLTSTSQYADARTWSIQAATDLYGAGSNEVTQVTNAWNAVGVNGSTSTGTVCSDIYESNDSRSASKTIAVNSDITARIGSSSDKDWFVFTTSASAPKVKVTLGNLPHDYDLRLYNANGTQIGISQNGGTTAESISYNGSSIGATYYVQVYAYGSSYSTTSCYTLRASTSNVNQLVDESSVDDNNSLMKSAAAETTDAVTVYPNPAKEKLTLSFVADAAGTQSVTITDITGRVLLQQSVIVAQGSNNISLPLNGYSSGMYFLNVSGRQTTKFQVVE